MEAKFERMSLKPSALVLRDLSARHAGAKLGTALQEAGFSRCAVDWYLAQRAGTQSHSDGPNC